MHVQHLIMYMYTEYHVFESHLRLLRFLFAKKELYLGVVSRTNSVHVYVYVYTFLMSIRVHLSPGGPYVNCLYKYHLHVLMAYFSYGTYS